MKKQRGITLIVLIITIIIMLILAGVVINLTIGKNGIFKIAKQAVKNYTNAEAKELADLDNITNIVDQAINDETGENGGTEPSTPETPTIDESVLALKAGDYILYNCEDEEILCRVLYPTTSEYGLQIISNYNVKRVPLSSDNYSEAIESYNNAIETLNNEAEAYINTEYAYDARCVGSAPTVEKGMLVNKNKVRFEGTTEYVTPNTTHYLSVSPSTSGASDFECLPTDVNYEVDLNQATDLALWEEYGDFWLASRWYYEYGCGLNVRQITDYGGESQLCFMEKSPYGDGGFNINFQESGLRPCISLKSDIIKIIGGDGESEDSAYVIGK